MFEVAILIGLLVIALASIWQTRQAAHLQREVETSRAALESVLATLRDRL